MEASATGRWLYSPRVGAVAALTPIASPSSEARAGFDRGQLALLAGLIAVGTGIRVWISLTNYGVRYDTDSARIVAHVLVTNPLSVYATHRWPYPPGFFPVLLAVRSVARATGAHFWALWKIPAILGDAGIAAVLAWGLGRLGAAPRERLATVALVALGPIFVIISGYHGQLDPVAILPALLAVVIWRLAGPGRAWRAGLLIGLGTAIKTVPLFMVLALLPTARTRREAAVLVGCAVALPLAALAPWLLAHPHETYKGLTFNHGIPGFGGLSLIIQPGLATSWLHGQLPRVTSATWFFYRQQNLIVGLAALLAGAYVGWRRMEPVRAAALIWLVVFVANFNWAYQYFIWALPFFLLAGWRRGVAALQLTLLLPAAELYFGFAVPSLVWLYVPLMAAVWLAFAIATAAVLVGDRGFALRARAAPA
jgi:hypothetical protein